MPIRSHLPEPTLCDNCASPNVEYKSNAAIYGKPLGDWPFCWHCDDCGAAVGCHNKTRLPLGRMADKRTRKLRKQVHDAFDPIWESQAISRTEAYCKLAQHLNINPDQCHISQLSYEQLTRALDFCRHYSDESILAALKRRKEKKNVRTAKRHERERKQTERFAKFTHRNTTARRSRRRPKDCD